jgi:hypothetical protein
MAQSRKLLPTPEQVENLAAIGLSWADIAAILGVSLSTVSRRGYGTAIGRGHARQREAICLAQMRLLGKDDAAMAIHLGKTKLGQTYKESLELEITNPDADTAAARRDLERVVARIALTSGSSADPDDAVAEDGASAPDRLRLSSSTESTGAD